MNSPVLAAHAALMQRIESIELPPTVDALLARAAAQFGEREALCFFEDGQSLSFKALSESVRQLAAALHQSGVRKGSRVAVMLPNRIEFPLTWLALARLGAVMTPVITRSTPRELSFLFSDAEISFVVVDETLLPALASLRDDPICPAAAQTIVVAPMGATYGGDAGRDFWAVHASGDSAFEPAESPGPDDLLNIQYTSGTTGMPKGVMQSHTFWVHCGCTPALVWSEAGIQSILSDHPFYYLDPQWMLIMGLYTGARVDFSKRMSVKRFMEWMRTRKAELAWFADPLLKNAAQASDKDHAAKLFLAYHFSKDMLIESERRYGVRFREAYGMTEIGSGLMVPWDVEDQQVFGTCGLPAPWRRCKLVDLEGRIVKPGEPGELWVTGPGISSGYYKRPEANAETFVDGWFRTGDLFVQDEQGYFSIVGRLKDMIKRSGENIAAAEVERVLLEMPQIVDAAVVPVPDKERDEEVKAYVLLAEGCSREQLPPQAILEHCLARLAKFKLPRYIEYVTSLPYTPSEKVAKHQLIAASPDLRVNAYDAVDHLWR